MQIADYKKINERLITETLPNGLTIKIVPRPDYNKCYAMFATDYGGADRRFKLGGKWLDTPAGVAHFLEHKMFDMPYGNALSVLSSNGASPNAFTGSGMTAYHFECTQLFYENLDVLLEFVSTPYFSAESVSKEQGIIGQEIRMIEDSPDFIIYNNLLRSLYLVNPVRDSVAGSVESIAEITEKTLNDCHRVFYNPSNMALAVVGNADPEKIIEAARKILPAEPGERPERDYGVEPSPLPNRREIAVDMEVSAPLFLLGCAFPPENGRARLKQLLTAELTLRMLFGRSSPLFTDLYAEGLLNGGFDYETDFTAGTAMAIVGGESRDVPAVLARINSHLSSMITGGVDPELFGRSKKALYGSQLRLLGSFSALSQSLVTGVFSDFNPLDAFDLIDEVTQGDVSGFIASHLTEEKTAVSILNPLGEIE
ncbi:MAG: insulinase family protein [Oscillospiraceae bacterium]|jgi:predicted Zn-dependent peptidase|nr:insulinase family protein [Oscillospiraceae bacterium]